MLLLTPEERKEFVDVHNYLRKVVTPQASNMQELEYNEAIETDVNRYLELCKFEHRKLDGYGENGRLATDKNITDTVMSWFQERVYFNYSAVDPLRCAKENSKTEYLNKVECGHYKMMVRDTLKSLGCGYKFCKIANGSGETFYDSFITFCFYDVGQQDKPYEVGKSCTGCERGYLFCKDDLCTPKSRYDKNQTSCNLKCLNCGKMFNQKACLCDCPLITKEGVCRGTTNDTNCNICDKNALSCNNGKREISNDKCTCKCNDLYQGEFCDIRKDQYEASYQHVIDGAMWRYNMSLPINIVEFKSSFETLQNLVATEVLNLCSKELNLTSCSDIIVHPINYNDVLLIPSYPLILENGSLILRMFINYSVITRTQKEERFVNSSILHRIWNSPSTNLNLFIDNIRRIYPKKLNFNLITTNQPTTSTKVIIKSLSTTESNQPTQIIQTNLPLQTTNQILSTSQTFQQNNFSETIGNSSVSSLTTTKTASLSNKCDFTSIFILSSILLENFT